MSLLPLLQQRWVDGDGSHDIRAGHGHAHEAIARSAADVDVSQFFLNLFKFFLDLFGLLHHFLDIEHRLILMFVSSSYIR
jgi:hypothetical protein